MRAVSAPTVVIIAAGEGTRMRSALPKVLHPLCGRPLILWPVAAALEAGAGKVVVVDNPKRRLEDRLPEGVEVAVQERAERDRATRSPRPATHIDADATVVVINGDVPLITAEAISDLVEAHEEQRRRRARWPRWSSTTPPATAASSATATATSSGSSRPRREGDATPEQLAIREVNTGVYAFDGAQPARRARPRSTPTTPRASSTCPTCCRSCARPGKTIAAHLVTDPTLTLGVNDRVDLAQVRKLAQQRIHERHARNGVTIVDPDVDARSTSA